MIPTIALVGRPNVGKSTLFNCLTQSRDALVADQPGLTRDRKYGQGNFEETQYMVIDTGGLSGDKQDLDQLMAQQVWQAVEEADVVLFLVDGRGGINPGDNDIAKKLRQSQKQVMLVINKTDGLDPDVAASDFYRLGFGEVCGISASHRRGISQLMTQVVAVFPEQGEDNELIDAKGIRIAIVGRPNVGKSTLVNRMLGEERVLAFDLPGTTRDSIAIPFEKNGKPYTLIDTAGVRRRRQIRDKVEKFSVIKALQSVDAAQVVILVLDAQEAITDQDAHLMGYIVDSGRALIIGVNKWDGLDDYQRQQIKETLNRKFTFVNYASIHFISALHGTGVGKLISVVDKVYAAATKDLSTPEINRILEQAIFAHPPHLVRGRRIKLRYAHQGGKNPPLIVIHGNQVDKVSPDYRRYLINYFREAFQLDGTPVRIDFKAGSNPYKDKGNTLTARQITKKQRLMKHTKKKK